MTLRNISGAFSSHFLLANIRIIFTERLSTLRRRDATPRKSSPTSTSETVQEKESVVTCVSSNLTEGRGRIKLESDDVRVVFKQKTLWELIRALLVFKLCSYDAVVDNSVMLMTLGQRLLGTRMFSSVMTPLFYRQFVAGSNRQDLNDCVRRLRTSGIGALLVIPIEEYPDDCIKADSLYSDNLRQVLECIKLARDVQTTNPMMQLKLTALLPAQLCSKLSTLGVEESNARDLVKQFADAMESEEKVAMPGLSDVELDHLTKGLARIHAVGKLAVEKNVIVMVDAEYVSINPALSLLSLAMMVTCNHKSAVVFNTYQNYLKTTLQQLRYDTDMMDEFGVCFGAKLVRGAYMESERMLAKHRHYPDPINETFDATSNMYRESLELMFWRIARVPGRNKIVIASHNHSTVQFAIDRMQQYAFDMTEGSIFFAQLFGIADYLSFSLGARGFPVYKSIPYGAVMDTLPYLSRRAQENRAALRGLGREQDLLKNALKARVLGT